MNIEQIEKTKEEIIKNALEWANFKECIPLEQSDILVLGEFLKIRIPKRFEMFEYSNNPNHARTTGGEKIIFNTLSTLKSKLLYKFDENRVETRGLKKGAKFSEEHKFKQKINAKKRVAEEGSVCGFDIKPIVQLSKNDGSFIARYDNAKLALAELGKPRNRSDIGACCKGVRNKKTAYGYKWMFEEDYNELKNNNDFISVEEISRYIKDKYNLLVDL